MTFNRIALLHIALLIIVIIFSVTPWYFLMLTASQLLFVPLALLLIMKKETLFYTYYPYFAIPAFVSVSLLQITPNTVWDMLFAAVYLLFTFVVAMQGIHRFFNRGFAYLEEFSIDVGMIYLFIGGLWFFAHEADIETGFSPIITWLTGIHFHYSAFLLPIFVGFLGRLVKTTLYRIVCTIILISPILVALGITFLPWLEIVSVFFYIIGIYGLIILTFKAPFTSFIQKWFIRLSFGALGITIIFSLLYASGNVFGAFSVSIDFMLRFHGFFNCVLFALCGIIGWSIFTPSSKDAGWNFPISKIRGNLVIGEQILIDYKDANLKYSYKGLVDNMNIYEPGISRQTLSPTIIDFYENTHRYRLFAEVNWHSWFKPFASVYRIISRNVKQLNLPFSNKQMEMTGDIHALQDVKDGRTNTRAWIRKIDTEVIFVALYSCHRINDKTYMNIALPLPWSSMIGILELQQKGENLLLTSQGATDSDSGIYLAIYKYVFKLPLQEQFLIEEIEAGHLSAKHRMRIFSLPFLTINYAISQKDIPR